MGLLCVSHKKSPERKKMIICDTLRAGKNLHLFIYMLTRHGLAYCLPAAFTLKPNYYDISLFSLKATHAAPPASDSMPRMVSSHSAAVRRRSTYSVTG